MLQAGAQNRRDLSDKEVYYQLVKRAELELRQKYPTARNAMVHGLAKELAKTWQLSIKGKDVVPANWWQKLKLRWAPEWVTALRPVKYRAVEKVRTFAPAISEVPMGSAITYNYIEVSTEELAKMSPEDQARAVRISPRLYRLTMPKTS